MKIALAQLNFFVGDFDGNVAKMLAAVETAKQQGADLVVFPELSTCGYPPRDFLEFDDFIRRSQRAVLKLAEAAQGIAIAVGSPSKNPVVEGKDLYNSAYFLEDGQIKHVQHKALLPTYDVFDEYRHFEPAKEFSVVEFKGKRIALSICEDLWNLGNENPLYTVVPMDEMMPQKPDLIVNLSASPFTYSHAEERIHVLRANVQRYGLPMVYCNQVGSQTDIIFDGGSIVISPDGNVYEEMPYWEECVKTFDLQEVMNGGRHQEQPKEKIALIHDALLLGIRDYFKKLGFKQAILGLSGGIDSAVVAVLAARALGEDNVRVLLMPSQFSSDHSINDARALAVNLGIQYDIVPIEPIFAKYEETLKPHFLGYPNNVTEENIQARIRGMLLMAMSNKFGNVLLNTTNKSEMAVGYGTLYGDLCGGLGRHRHTRKQHHQAAQCRAAPRPKRLGQPARIRRAGRHPVPVHRAAARPARNHPHGLRRGDGAPCAAAGEHERVQAPPSSARAAGIVEGVRGGQEVADCGEVFVVSFFTLAWLWRAFPCPR